MLCPLHIYDDTYKHKYARTFAYIRAQRFCGALCFCTSYRRTIAFTSVHTFQNRSFYIFILYINTPSMIQRSMLLPQAFAINTIVRFSLHSHSKSYRIHKWVATCTSSFSQNAFCSPYTQVHLTFRLRFQFQFRFHFYFVTILVSRLDIFRSHLNAINDKN